MNVKKRQGAFWIGLIFGLFAVHMSVASALVYFAHSDPSHAVVPDYHERALAWDDTKRQKAASEALGWKALLVAGPDDGPVQERSLTLTIVDADGSPIENASVSVSAFHIARSGDPVELAFKAAQPGLYTARERLPRYGIWEFQIEALYGEHTFLTDMRIELRPGRSSSS